jgi:hypothetical protein
MDSHFINEPKKTVDELLAAKEAWLAKYQKKQAGPEAYRPQRPVPLAGLPMTGEQRMNIPPFIPGYAFAETGRRAFDSIKNQFMGGPSPPPPNGGAPPGPTPNNMGRLFNIIPGVAASGPRLDIDFNVLPENLTREQFSQQLADAMNDNEEAKKLLPSLEALYNKYLEEKQYRRNVVVDDDDESMMDTEQQDVRDYTAKSFDPPEKYEEKFILNPQQATKMDYEFVNDGYEFGQEQQTKQGFEDGDSTAVTLWTPSRQEQIELSNYQNALFDTNRQVASLNMDNSISELENIIQLYNDATNVHKAAIYGNNVNSALSLFKKKYGSDNTQKAIQQAQERFNDFLDNGEYGMNLTPPPVKPIIVETPTFDQIDTVAATQLETFTLTANQAMNALVNPMLLNNADLFPQNQATDNLYTTPNVCDNVNKLFGLAGLYNMNSKFYLNNQNYLQSLIEISKAKGPGHIAALNKILPYVNAISKQPNVNVNNYARQLRECGSKDCDLLEQIFLEADSNAPVGDNKNGLLSLEPDINKSIIRTVADAIGIYYDSMNKYKSFVGMNSLGQMAKYKMNDKQMVSNGTNDTIIDFFTGVGSQLAKAADYTASKIQPYGSTIYNSVEYAAINGSYNIISTLLGTTRDIIYAVPNFIESSADRNIKYGNMNKLGPYKIDSVEEAEALTEVTIGLFKTISDVIKKVSVYEYGVGDKAAVITKKSFEIRKEISDSIFAAIDFAQKKIPQKFKDDPWNSIFFALNDLALSLANDEPLDLTDDRSLMEVSWMRAHRSSMGRPSESSTTRSSLSRILIGNMKQFAPKGKFLSVNLPKGLELILSDPNIIAQLNSYAKNGLVSDNIVQLGDVVLNLSSVCKTKEEKLECAGWLNHISSVFNTATGDQYAWDVSSKTFQADSTMDAQFSLDVDETEMNRLILEQISLEYDQKNKINVIPFHTISAMGQAKKISLFNRRADIMISQLESANPTVANDLRNFDDTFFKDRKNVQAAFGRLKMAQLYINVEQNVQGKNLPKALGAITNWVFGNQNRINEVSATEIENFGNIIASEFGDQVLVIQGNRYRATEQGNYVRVPGKLEQLSTQLAKSAQSVIDNPPPDFPQMEPEGPKDYKLTLSYKSTHQFQPGRPLINYSVDDDEADKLILDYKITNAIVEYNKQTTHIVLGQVDGYGSYLVPIAFVPTELGNNKKTITLNSQQLAEFIKIDRAKFFERLDEGITTSDSSKLVDRLSKIEASKYVEPTLEVAKVAAILMGKNNKFGKKSLDLDIGSVADNISLLKKAYSFLSGKKDSDEKIRGAGVMLDAMKSSSKALKEWSPKQTRYGASEKILDLLDRIPQYKKAELKRRQGGTKCGMCNKTGGGIKYKVHKKDPKDITCETCFNEQGMTGGRFTERDAEIYDMDKSDDPEHVKMLQDQNVNNYLDMVETNTPKTAFELFDESAPNLDKRFMTRMSNDFVIQRPYDINHQFAKRDQERLAYLIGVHETNPEKMTTSQKVNMEALAINHLIRKKDPKASNIEFDKFETFDEINQQLDKNPGFLKRYLQ